MSFVHYKIGARSGAIWTATQLAYKFLTPLNPEDIILFTGTPANRMLRTCEKAPYRYYSKVAEVPAGINEMRILCEYNAVDAVYETDTFIGTLIWNREYWQERINYEWLTTTTQLLVRACSRAGIPNIDNIGGSRGVSADLRKIGNVAEYFEYGIDTGPPEIPRGWAAPHLFVYLTMDHALHDAMIDKNAYGRCINIVGPWQTYFAGAKELKANIKVSDVASAVEAEVSALFGVPATTGNVTQLVQRLPADLLTKAAAKEFIETGGRSLLNYA